MHEAIWNNIHYKQFYLAEGAPICKDTLQGEFGYNAVSPTSLAVLDGVYEYPDDFEAATRKLCEECARIRWCTPKNAVRSTINRDKWKVHWKKTKEATSSSFSGRHIRHYKAVKNLGHTSHYQALQASLVLHHGLVLERWASSLLVML
jgi:hypothetical protein